MVSWVWIPVSLFIGVFFGVLFMGLCVAKGDDDDD